MARCPECGAWMWHPPQWFEEHVCPNCGAVLKLKASLGGFFLGSLEVVGHTTNRRQDYEPAPRESLPHNIQDIGESYVPDQEEEAPSQEEAQFGECEYCHARIMAPNARFCSNCGASLSYGPTQARASEAGEDTRREEGFAAVTEQEEDCIVCSLRLTKDNDVVWCPHCGGLAHRNHMLDWVQAKGCCPACDQPLSKEYYE